MIAKCAARLSVAKLAGSLPAAGVLPRVPLSGVHQRACFSQFPRQAGQLVRSMSAEQAAAQAAAK